MTQEIAGYVADAILIISAAIYIRRILAGRIESSLVTRGIWAVVTFMLALFYWQSVQGTYAIGISVLYFLFSIVVFILLLVKRKGAHWDWLDKVAVVAIPVIFVLWYFSGSSPLALWLTLLLDAIGAVILIRVQYKALFTGTLVELPLTFWLDTAANAVNLFAIKELNVINAAYPIYLLVLVLTIAILSSVWVWRYTR